MQNDRPKITTVMTLVTPQLASEWLEKNNTGNRNIRKGDVEILRAIIAQGLWEPTHQGIGFYDDGTVADGQHRLTAIVQAGISVWVNVTTGLPRRAIHAIDGGLIRTNLDRLHFSGIDSDTHRVSTCNILISQYKTEEAGRGRWKTAKLPSKEFQDFYQLFLESIEFVLSFKRPDRFPSPATAAVASAWYTQDRDRLADFMVVMQSGETPSPKDAAAIRIRDHINKGKYGAGSPARNDLFLRCCGALRYFLSGKPVSKLYAIPDHAFPLVGPLSSVKGVG
jgi:hypothetical protein